MAKASKKFVYRGGERKVEDVVRRSKQSSGLYDNYILGDFSKLKVKEGECTFRILPPTWEDTDKWGDSWEIPLYIHYKVGADEGTFLCLDKMFQEPCPVCEARRDAVDEEERDALKPSWRAICWAIDRDNEKAGPQIWDLPATLFRDINARAIDKKTNSIILLDDPEEGFDVTFNREGTDMRTKYTGVEVMRDATPLHDNEKTQDRWIAYITEHPLPDVLLIQDPEYIEKVLSGKVSRKKDGDEEEEEAAPRSRRRAPAEEEEEPAPRRRRAEAESATRRGSRRAAEPEEEVEEEADTEADPPSTKRALRRPSHEAEEEEPVPRRSNRRAAEPEEEEVEEEEEEAPPRRSSRRAPAEEADPLPRTTRRRAPAAEEEEDDTPPSKDPPESRAARKGLEKLRPGARAKR